MATRIAYRASPGTDVQGKHNITNIPGITVTFNEDTIEFSEIPEDDRTNWQNLCENVITNVIRPLAGPYSFLKKYNDEVQRFLFCYRRFATSSVEVKDDGEVVISNETNLAWPDLLKEWIKHLGGNNIAVHVTKKNDTHSIFLDATPNVSLLLDMNERKLTSQWEELTRVIADPTNDKKRMIMREIFHALSDGFPHELLPLYTLESIQQEGPRQILKLVKSQSAAGAIEDLSTKLSNVM